MLASKNDLSLERDCCIVARCLTSHLVHSFSVFIQLVDVQSNASSYATTLRARSERRSRRFDRQPVSPDALSDPRLAFRQTEADLVDSGRRRTPSTYYPAGGRRASANVDDGATHHSPLLADRSGFQDPRVAREAALRAERERTVAVTTDHGLRRVERAPSFSHQALEDIVKSSDRVLKVRAAVAIQKSVRSSSKLMGLMSAGTTRLRTPRASGQYGPFDFPAKRPSLSFVPLCTYL